jgi:exosortase
MNFSHLPSYAKEPVSLAKISGCTLLLAVLYLPTLSKLATDWTELPEYSHGFFIPLLALFFVWRQSRRLESTPVVPSYYGLPILVLGLLMFFIGQAAAETFILRLSLLVVIAGIILFLLGWQCLKVLAFPIAFMGLMVPLPSILYQKITFPMQLFASKVAKFFVTLLGIPIFREGNIIYLQDITLEVAEACSGIRSLIGLFAATVTYAYLINRSLLHRILLVLSCFPIAIIANALRVTLTAILANRYGPTVAQGFHHDFSSLALFAITLSTLISVDLLMLFFAHRVIGR